jgi:tetratricopeptide (TPR) repeat protein
MVNQEETLVVSDQGNNRIHLFQPGQATIMLREVKQLALKDDWATAMPKIERILYLKPNEAQARELMVNALYYFGDKAFAEGDFLRAEEYFRRVLRYRPDDPNIPQKLDAIFWASNQGLIANVVFGIIAVIIALILIWILKTIISRFIFSRT